MNRRPDSNDSSDSSSRARSEVEADLAIDSRSQPDSGRAGEPAAATVEAEAAEAAGHRSAGQGGFEEKPADVPEGHLFRLPAFRFFWFARTLSSLSFQMLAVAIGWHIYAITHSAFALGLVGLAQFLPMFALTLVVGHVADRYDRRRIAAICQGVEAIAALIFMLGTFGGWLSAPVIYALAAGVGAARAFESPAMSSLVPGVVPRDRLTQATAWSTSANQSAQVIGPALGGLLYGVGPSVAYIVCMVSFCCAALCASAVALRTKPPSRTPVTLESVFSGIAFIRREPVILGALSLDLFAVLFGGATALLPIFARDVLHAGPFALGMLRSASAVGALAGTVWIAHFPLTRRPGRAMFGGVIAFGIATVVFGLSQSIVLSWLALFTLGAADVISVVVRLSLVQLRTPDDMLGRVNAVNSLFIGTSNQLGEFESGLTAGWWGAKPAAMVGGLATIGVALLWMRLFPGLRNTQSLDRDDDAARV